ncbi:helix-turn-helix transcriptional regulator [Microbacterium sp. NPDC076768]|uniref:helix-turn-helix domain-containing protein n=1 Tax=Microbacterium sp. NPDC076768 TaxID=3154858 RepID=UPI0034378E98
MNNTRIVELRQSFGWTQERLAAESGVGLRTIQRLEAGSEAGLETLSMVAAALRVSVSDLFSRIDDADFGSRVEALQSRVVDQQAAYDRAMAAWRWLYVGIGVVLSFSSFPLGQLGVVLFLSYWTGGLLILIALRRIIFEPRLEQRYPLARRRRQPHVRDKTTPVVLAATDAEAGTGRR